MGKKIEVVFLSLMKFTSLIRGFVFNQNNFQKKIVFKEENISVRKLT